MLSKEQKERYERSLLVQGFSEEAMAKLSRATIAVVGAGGLGSAVLYYLTAAGAGRLRIIDHDTIIMSNLQRQILYSTPQIGYAKAEEAAKRLSRLNPLIDIEAFSEKLDERNAANILSGCDVVMDCTDNYRARYIIDDFCSSVGIPMIYGTAQDMNGQVAVFNFNGGPSYRDLYPEEAENEKKVGVLPPVVGITGSMQAMEAMKIICEIGTPLSGRVLMFSALNMDVSIFEL